MLTKRVWFEQFPDYLVALCNEAMRSEPIGSGKVVVCKEDVTFDNGESTHWISAGSEIGCSIAFGDQPAKAVYVVDVGGYLCFLCKVYDEATANKIAELLDRCTQDIEIMIDERAKQLERVVKCKSRLPLRTAYGILQFQVAPATTTQKG